MDKGLRSIDLKEISSYIHEVKSLQVLSKDEEFILAKKFKEKNDLNAIRKLVESNLYYIVRIAKKYDGYGIFIKDLVQEGIIGFIKSIKSFDTSRNIRLISFAFYWIKSEIHDYIVKNSRIVKIANTKPQKKLFFNLKKIKKNIWFNEDECKVVSNLLNMHSNNITYMESRLNKNDVPLDLNIDSRTFHGDIYSNSSLFLNFDSDASFIVECDNWNMYLVKKLKNAIKKLDERSRDILRKRWLLRKKSTLRDLAEKYSVSSERIRQLENNAFKKVRMLMNLDMHDIVL